MVPTIRIKAAVSEDNSLGYIVINAEDFDADVHEALDPVDAIAGDGPGEALPAGDGMSEMGAQPARRGRKPKAE